MAKVKRIDHVAILVEDIDQTLEFWQDALGIPLSHIDDIPSEQSRVAFLPLGNSEIELVQPTTTDSGLARFLKKRGPGLHHVCIEVDDIEAMLASLKEKGIQLINETSVCGADGRQYAFIHPKSAHGVLVELYELYR
jgi:methylmalonyl-CoA/ethylmalonyl-CoA epimerase